MNNDDDFNEREFLRSFEQDRDSELATLTRREVREIREMLDERRMRKRANAFLIALAKWIVVVGASVTALQTGWSNLIKWLAK